MAYGLAFENIGKKPWREKKARWIGSQRCYFRYEELSKSGDKAGYRQMTQRLQFDHHLVVERERVRKYVMRKGLRGDQNIGRK